MSENDHQDVSPLRFETADVGIARRDSELRNQRVETLTERALALSCVHAQADASLTEDPAEYMAAHVALTIIVSIIALLLCCCCMVCCCKARNKKIKKNKKNKNGRSDSCCSRHKKSVQVRPILTASPAR